MLVDLCTLANVSIVMMDEKQVGYYIHGAAPWKSSDVPMDILNDEIIKEADDKSGTKYSRGLTHNPRKTKEERIQTFRAYFPKKIFEEMDRIRNMVIPTDALVDEKLKRMDIKKMKKTKKKI